MINFLGVGFSVLIKGVLFWKMKNIGTVSYPEVISRSLQLHFVKYHKKEPLSQTLVCCYIMALLFLETLIFFLSCFILIGWGHFWIDFYWIEFIIDFIHGFDLTLEECYESRVQGTNYYMKFTKVCVLVLQKQLVKCKVWFCNQVY